MSKNAATEGKLGALHDAVAELFLRVLKKYNKDMDTLENMSSEEMEEEMKEALLAADVMPNPAMLGAITKFLKDNEIRFATEAVSELSVMQTKLDERRKARKGIAELSNLRVVGE